MKLLHSGNAEVFFMENIDNCGAAPSVFNPVREQTFKLFSIHIMNNEWQHALQPCASTCLNAWLNGVWKSRETASMHVKTKMSERLIPLSLLPSFHSFGPHPPLTFPLTLIQRPSATQCRISARAARGQRVGAHRAPIQAPFYFLAPKPAETGDTEQQSRANGKQFYTALFVHSPPVRCLCIRIITRKKKLQSCLIL